MGQREGRGPLRLGKGQRQAVKAMDERDNTQEVVPVVAEHLEVGRRKVRTGAVRVAKQIREHEELVDVPLLSENVDIQRVVIDKPVEGPLPVRQEGDTTIIPLVEEVLIVEKRYVLKEEVRLTRRRSEHREQQKVTVMREVAEVSRQDAEGNDIPPQVVELPAPRPPLLGHAGRKVVRRNRIIK